MRPLLAEFDTLSMKYRANEIQLRTEADRCFSLANQAMGLRIADELEIVGRTLEIEATEITARLLHRLAKLGANSSYIIPIKEARRKWPEIAAFDFDITR